MGIYNGAVATFNIPEYMKIIKGYSNEFSGGMWVLVILSIVLVIAILVVIVLLFVWCIRKILKFRKIIVEQEELLNEVTKLESEVVKLQKEKTDIMTMKISQLGLKPEESNVLEGVSETSNDSEETDDSNIIIDSKTGLNINKENEIIYNVKYSSQFNNPSIKVKMYRRIYDEINSLNYEVVDLQEYISDTLSKFKRNEYNVALEPSEENEFVIHLKEGLKTGTYRIAFELYNNDSYIDEVYSYMIIK